MSFSRRERNHSDGILGNVIAIARHLFEPVTERLALQFTANLRDVSPSYFRKFVFEFGSLDVCQCFFRGGEMIRCLLEEIGAELVVSVLNPRDE